MIKKTLPLLLLGTLIVAACKKKEPTQWDTDWAAPVAHGHLTINDMIPVKYTVTNSDNYLSLVINESVFAFSLDTLLEIPNRSAALKTAIDVPSLDIPPTFLSLNSLNQIYEIDDVELKRIIIASGKATSTAQSEWNGKTEVFLNLPKLVNAAGPLQHTFKLDAGTPEAPTQEVVEFDMANYDMDLTGMEGDQYNTVELNVIVSSGEEADTYTVTNTDSVSLSFAFQDMVARYAKGYFGQHHFTDTTGFALPPMKKIVAGSVDLDSIDLNVIVKNGFNLIAQAEITQLRGINSRTGEQIDLSFPQLGTVLNINPASGGLYDYTPSEYPMDIHNQNSNIIDLLESLADSVTIGYDLEINPFGNISGGDDEFFPGSKMEIFVQGEFPMRFGADDLTIEDTLTLEPFANSTVQPQNGMLTLDYTNAFPISAAATFYLMDENGIILDSLKSETPIQPGAYDAVTYATTPYEGQATFTTSNTNLTHLEQTHQLLLSVAFNSDGNEIVKIAPEAYFDFNLHTNLQLRISIK